jgi:hypothetical protein
MVPHSTPGAAKIKILTSDFLKTYHSQLKAALMLQYLTQISELEWKPTKSCEGSVSLLYPYFSQHSPNSTRNNPWKFHIKATWVYMGSLSACSPTEDSLLPIFQLSKKGPAKARHSNQHYRQGGLGSRKWWSVISCSWSYYNKTKPKGCFVLKVNLSAETRMSVLSQLFTFSIRK